MFKLLTFFLCVSLSSISFSSEEFWADIKAGKKIENNTKITGLIASIKRKVRARENYYAIDLKDPNSKSFVEVRLYTIIKNKRINKIDCEENETLTLTGTYSIKSKKFFQFKKRKNRVGFVTIKKKDKSLKCIKPTKEVTDDSDQKK